MLEGNCYAFEGNYKISDYHQNVQNKTITAEKDNTNPESKDKSFKSISIHYFIDHHLLFFTIRKEMIN